MENLERFLVEHEFFKDMRKQDLDLIVGCASNVRFEAGQFLMREGEPARQCFLVRRGKVSLETYGGERGVISIMTLGEGEVLGFSWLFPPYQCRFDARALDLTRAIALDGECLRTKAAQDREMGYELMIRFAAVMGRELEATRLQLLNVYETHP